jgi:hypothetical protein
MSVTRDLGATWELFAADRYLGRFVFGGGTIVAAGAMLGTGGRSWGIHRSGWDAQRWQECNRDIRPAAAAVTRLGRRRFLFCTLDGEILESTSDGRTWESLLQQAGVRWASLHVARGPVDTAEVLAAYDPHRRGLLLSDGNLRTATLRPQNDGLFVGAFIKSGASCHPAADGLTWFIVINDGLWIGRRTPNEQGPTILETRCTPSGQWLAPGARAGRGLRFAVAAKVHHPEGPAALQGVTVGLTILGIQRPQALYDDGRHADGKASDGLWAARINVPPKTAVRLPPNDPRPRLPGTIAVNLTAVDKKRRRDRRVAVLAVYHKPGPLRIWPGGGGNDRSLGLEGPVTVRTESPPPSANQPAAIVIEATGRGPWRAGWGAGGWSRLNFAGRNTLSLQVKGTVSQELLVHLVDHYGDVDQPHFSRGVHLIAGRLLKAVTGKYQRVRIPVSRLLPKGTLFLRQHGVGVGLSTGAGGKPGRYWLADVQLLP